MSDRTSVYISYAWKSPAGDPWVLRLAEVLKEAGIEVALDKWILGAGDNWKSRLQTAAERSQYVLLVEDSSYWAKARRDNTGVFADLQWIRQRLKDETQPGWLLPLLREGQPSNLTFPEIQCVDLRPAAYEDGIRGLGKSLGVMLYPEEIPRVLVLPRPEGVIEARSYRPGFTRDSTGGDDLLDQGRELDALARIVSRRQAVTPISIALLGEWGSGKSYFMSLLRTRVDSLVAAGESKETVQHVAHISFNAWHYADANLWANLVDQVFEGLARESRVNDKKVSVKEQDARIRALTAEVSKAEDAVDRATSQLAIAQAEVENFAAARWVTRKTLDRVREEARALGIAGAADDIGAVLRMSCDAQSTAGPLRLALRTRRGKLAIAAALVLMVAGLFATWLIKSYGPAMAGLGAAAAASFGVLQPLLKALSQFAATARSAEEEAVRSGAVVQELRPGKAYKEAVERRDALRATVERLREEREFFGAKAFASYANERAASGDYRRQQGVVATARRDLERLSLLLQDVADKQQLREELAAEGLRPVERIILYVDDLDRCHPKRVVEVLEAVHLLLAFPLFVVVVGVDPRWMLRSLEVHYRDVIGGPENGPDVGRYAVRGTTPEDYLEKIFQIPLALGTPSAEGFGKLIDRLTVDGGEVAEHSEVPSEVVDQARVADVRPASEERVEGRKRVEEADKLARKNGDDGRGDVTGLTISDVERDLLKRLHALVPTPRNATRLVNVYRVLRASVRPDIRAELERNPGPVLYLLAVLYGKPHAFGPIAGFVVHEDGRRARSLGAALLDGAGSFQDIAPLDRRALAETLRDVCGGELGWLAAWVPIVSRFSFRATERFDNVRESQPPRIIVDDPS